MTHVPLAPQCDQRGSTTAKRQATATASAACGSEHAQSGQVKWRGWGVDPQSSGTRPPGLACSASRAWSAVGGVHHGMTAALKACWRRRRWPAAGPAAGAAADGVMAGMPPLSLLLAVIAAAQAGGCGRHPRDGAQTPRSSACLLAGRPVTSTGVCGTACALARFKEAPRPSAAACCAASRAPPQIWRRYTRLSHTTLAATCMLPQTLHIFRRNLLDPARVPAETAILHQQHQTNKRAAETTRRQANEKGLTDLCIMDPAKQFSKRGAGSSCAQNGKPPSDPLRTVMAGRQHGPMGLAGPSDQNEAGSSKGPTQA